MLRGGEGTDMLRGGGGDDVLVGGEGADTAVFAGARAGYDITVNADGTITVADTDATDGDTGTDTLSSVEALKFSDGFQVLEGLSIQAAVDAASVGDMIFVADGTYDETVTISTANLTIKGADVDIEGIADGAAVTLGSGDDTVLLDVKGHAQNGGEDGGEEVYAFNDGTTLRLGDGLNTLTASALADNVTAEASAYGANGVGLYGGADADTLSFSATAESDEGRAQAFGIKGGSVQLYGGDDSLSLNVGVTGSGTDADVNAATLDFSYTGAIQTGSIAESGIYTLSLGGAFGGSSTDYGYSGGTGALATGTIYLPAGTTFSVLVGGNGQTGEFSGGGGGLSFLDIGSDGVIEAIAGGGGGAGLYEDGGAGLAGPDGGSLYFQGADSQYGSGAGGVAGNGGQAGGGDSGSGGAGILGPGGNSTYDASTSTGGASAPTWPGGAAGIASGAGGFGGGGGGNKYGGGGAGGYSGGGGGDGYTLFMEPGGAGGGGGGGSYLSPLLSDRSLTAGGATPGAFVSLSKKPTDPVAVEGIGGGATVMTGAGADDVDIELTLTSGTTYAVSALGIDGSTLETGEGDDSVTIDIATTLTGTPSFETIRALQGATVDLGAGDDSLTLTGRGNDIAARSTVTAGAGDDTVLGGAVFDSTVDLGDGADTLTLTGQSSIATLQGGTGDDTITFGTGTATVIGGEDADGQDIDTLVLSQNRADYAAVRGTDPETVTLQLTQGGAVDLSVAEIENFTFDDGTVSYDALFPGPPTVTGPGDEFLQAGATGTSTSGNINSYGDVDVFRIVVDTPGDFKALVTGAYENSFSGGISDSKMFLFDLGSTQLASNDDYSGYASVPGMGYYDPGLTSGDLPDGTSSGAEFYLAVSSFDIDFSADGGWSGGDYYGTFNLTLTGATFYDFM
jgi:hypothetical protein